MKSRLSNDGSSTASPRQFREKGPPNSKNDTWLLRQQFQELCHELIVGNSGTGASVAVNKKIEQDLWNFAFRQQIGQLEQQLDHQQRDPRNNSVQLTATRTSLQYFLELATGFYLQLVEEVSMIAGLDVYPLCRDRDLFGALSVTSLTANKTTNSDDESTIPKSIANYLIQHCLVHLGDLARYMAKATQVLPGTPDSPPVESCIDHLEVAQHYYVSAAMLVPNSGQPFNQLAIVEAQQGNKLGAAYLYARSLTTRNPFPAAEQNLNRLLERILASCHLLRDKQLQMTQIPVMIPPKSVSELVSVCIQLLATAWLKPTQSSAFVAQTLLSSLGNTNQSFLSDRVGSTFSWFQLVQLSFITAFIISRRHKQPQYKYALNFMAIFLHHLTRELLSSASNDSNGLVNLGKSPLLPATRLLLSFVAANYVSLLSENVSNPDEPSDEQAITNIRSPRLWHSVARLADLAAAGALRSTLPYSTPLPEDVELRSCSLFTESFAPDVNKPVDSHLNALNAVSTDSLVDLDAKASPTSGSNAVAAAYLSCARLSETCIRLATVVPNILCVIATDPSPRFSSPLPMPLPISSLQAPQQARSFSQLPTSKPNLAIDVDFDNMSFRKSEKPSVPQSSFPFQSSSSSMESPNNQVANSGDRPRNVVFQSIVHTMRNRTQPSTTASNTNVIGSPRLMHSKIVAPIPGSSGNNGNNRNEQSRTFVSSYDDSSSDKGQNAPHRNLPPRLARLAEAEANSRASSVVSRPVVPPTSNASSTSSGSSLRSMPQQFKIPPYRPPVDQQPVKQSNNFSTASPNLRDSRNTAPASFQNFATTTSGGGSGPMNYSLTDARYNSGSSLNAPLDDGWNVLQAIKAPEKQMPQTYDIYCLTFFL